MSVLKILQEASQEANSKERKAGQGKGEECQSERVQEHEMSSWERKTRSIAVSVAETRALSNTERQGEKIMPQELRERKPWAAGKT